MSSGPAHGNNGGGNGVGNNPVITTPKGDVLLASGRSVELTDHGNPHLRVEVRAPESETLDLGAVLSETRNKGILTALHAGGKANGAKKASLTGDGRIMLKADNKLVPDAPKSNAKANRPDCEEGRQPGGAGLMAAAARGQAAQGNGGAKRQTGGNGSSPVSGAAAQGGLAASPGGASSQGAGEPPAASTSSPGAPGTTVAAAQQPGTPESGTTSTAQAATRAPNACT